MTLKKNWLSAALITLIGVVPAAADDLTGADEVLCSGLFANRCFADGDCVSGTPQQWNIPQFIIFDLEDKMLRTTEASGLNRQTPIENVQREGDWIFLQGVEMGRAFSFAINEKSGDMTAAVAHEGVAVAAFGVCTPMDD
ncbi:MAG: hypothetical protein PVG92_05050 [Holophagae bacterium]|jgi:hypothetical protein